MRKKKIPRVMLAGTNSGCGKTTAVCGLLSLLKQHGIATASCKCGPDYIDPMFHGQVFGISAQNLDLFFAKKEMLTYLMGKNAGQVKLTVVEGVMGYYDGMRMDAADASSYDVARQTKTPVVLVVQAKGMAYSIVPLLKGMLEFCPDSQIKGVLLNGVSEMTGKQLKQVIERELPLRVYGYIPTLQEFRLESRHLGLVTSQELPDIQKKMEQLGRKMERCIDLDGILELARSAPDLACEMPTELEMYVAKKPGKGLRIGVAKDEAFCFYYKENLELLEQLGCELCTFRPLRDAQVPDGVDALLFGGGYPEVYAAQLSQNVSMLHSVKKSVEDGVFCMAECGGFMYLHDSMEGENGTEYPMAGVISGVSRRQERLVRFGYVNLKERRPDACPDDNGIKAHEFHYWDSNNNGTDFIAVKPSGKRCWECIHENEAMLAGYPHLYYLSNISFIVKLLEKIKERRKNVLHD